MSATLSGTGRRRRCGPLALLCLAAITGLHAFPSSAAAVTWTLPAESTKVPESDAAKELAKTQGRRLPTPELLQPRLDPGLLHFQPLPNARQLKGDFRAAASDVLPGLVQRWVAAFGKFYPGVKITLTPPYAGSLGAEELVKQNLDFVFVSRELRPDDIRGFQAKFGYPPLSVPIAGGSYRHYGFLDAVAFVVNKDNPLSQLTFEQLDAIYSSTLVHGAKPVTTWGQLGLTGEWTNRPVHPYGIKPWNGFEEFVRQRVLSDAKQRGEWRAGVNLDPVVFPVASHVAQDPEAIGYTGLAYVDTDVKILALAREPNGPFVAPSYENVANASYPLSRLMFFNTNAPPGMPLNPALEQFLEFVLSAEGQQIVLDQAIYVPLRATQAEASLQLLGNGRAQPSLASSRRAKGRSIGR
jgi:phosphate transport system substrate-binding protein